MLSSLALRSIQRSALLPPLLAILAISSASVRVPASRASCNPPDDPVPAPALPATSLTALSSPRPRPRDSPLVDAAAFPFRRGSFVLKIGSATSRMDLPDAAPSLTVGFPPRIAAMTDADGE